MKKMILITCLILITLPSLFLPVFAEQMECVITPRVLPDQRVLNNIPAVGPGDHVLGPDDAVVTFVVYGSFSCYYTPQALYSLMFFQLEHPEEVRVIFRPLLSESDTIYSDEAVYAAEAASEQGYYYDAIFILITGFNSSNWSWGEEEMSDYLDTVLIPNLESGSQWNAEAKKFDVEQWRKDFADKKMRSRCKKMTEAAHQTGMVTYTPTTFVNNTVYDSAFDGDYSKEILESILSLFSSQQRAFTFCPDIVTDSSKQYKAVLDTDKGQIDIDLYADKAPLAVNSFVYLAQNGWFSGNIFGRNGAKDFVMMSGDPTATGYGNAGYTYPFENSGIAVDQPGLVGMVKNGDGLNYSLFFISYDLDARYRNAYERLSPYLNGYESEDAFVNEKLESFAESNTIFGRVTPETYDVFLQIEPGDAIRSVTIITE